MRRNFAGHRENGEDRFVLRGPKPPKRRRRARMIACRCSEAEPREMQNRPSSEGAADDSSGVSISSVHSSAPSELGRMVCPVPGVPLRYTPRLPCGAPSALKSTHLRPPSKPGHGSGKPSLTPAYLRAVPPWFNIITYPWYAIPARQLIVLE